MEDSILRWVYTEFRDYINNITDKSVTIERALETLREHRWLPKEYRNNRIIEDIAVKGGEIRKLFGALRNASQPESLNLPFKIKDRERQLINNLVSYTGGNIDISKAYAKVVPEHSPQDIRATVDDNSRSFYYWLEVAIAARADDPNFNNAGQIEIIGCINGTPSLDGGGSYFQNGNYYWYNQGQNMINAIGLRSMLNECGFSTSSYFSQRRMASIVFVNLVTPCPEWGGAAGKQSINLDLYQNLIAKTVSSLAYKMPSLKGKGIKTRFDTGLGGIYKPFLVKFLRKRKAAIDANPSLAVTDRLTQSGVWYRIRPKMLEEGFRPRNKLGQNKNGDDIYDWGTTRTGLTSSINKVIKELWPEENVTRESLGVVAKARAMLYFNGQVYPVSFDTKEELVRIGTTDMVIVEKEGITDVLLEAAKKYWIALVATQGKFVDYVKDLMKLAHEVGINVCVLTDYDIDGYNMWRQANEKMGIRIKRIGITQDIITWLHDNGHYDVDIEDVEEEYQPNPSLFREGDDPYLIEQRIELDSIIQAVGADTFWEYIVYQLETEFPETRDYREILEEPEPTSYYPSEFNEIIEYLKNYTTYTYSKKWDDIKEQELKEVKGLLQVDDKKEDIDEVLKPIVVGHEGIITIVKKVNELMESKELPKIPEEFIKAKEKAGSDNNNQPAIQLDKEISEAVNNPTNEIAKQLQETFDQIKDVYDSNSDSDLTPSTSTATTPSDSDSGPDHKEILDLMDEFVNDLTGKRIYERRS